MFAELGLTDTYANDGRAILEVLDGNAVPHGLDVHRGQLQELGAAYKQLTAPFGSVGMDSLKYATAAIQTGLLHRRRGLRRGRREARLLAGAARPDRRPDPDPAERPRPGGPGTEHRDDQEPHSEANDLIAEVHAAAP